MKTVILVAALSSCLWSCNNKKEEQNFGKPTEPEAVEAKSAEFPLAEKGAALFEGKGLCVTCHKPDIKLIGPSLLDIAKTYKEKKASIASFLNGELDPIIDPTQFEVMKANFVVTKAMTDEERQALEQYIYSQGL
jgi:cytochrome c